MKKPLIALALAVASGSAAAGCPSDMVAYTKEGHFGSSTLAGYRTFVQLQTRRQVDELLQKVETGPLVRLPAGKAACIHASSHLSYRTLITMPQLDGAYWVHLHALDW